MPTTCLIIPCYNEGNRISLVDFDLFLERHEQVALYFVDDGSKDHTSDLLDSFTLKHPSQARVLVLNINQGKGEAIRQGVLQALKWQNFEYIGYADADLSTPLEELHEMLAYLEGEPTTMLVMGARMKRMGAVIQRNELRHYIGRVFASFASIILKLPVYDTQCGAKLFRRELVDIAFKNKFCSKWLFDIELLARMIHHYGHNEMAKLVIEHPLNTWIEKGDSRIRFIDVIRVPAKLIQIYWRYF